MSDLVKLRNEVKEVTAAVAKIEAISIAQDKIERFKAYKGIKLASVNDDKGYKVIKEHWQEVRNERLDCEKRFKEGKDPFLRLGKKCDDLKNKSINIVKPIEDELNVQVKIYENNKEAEAKKLYEKNHKRMVDAGYFYDGRHYIVGEMLISKEDFDQNHKEAPQMDYWVKTGSELRKTLNDAIARQNKVIEEMKSEPEEKATEPNKSWGGGGSYSSGPSSFSAPSKKDLFTNPEQPTTQTNNLIPGSPGEGILEDRATREQVWNEAIWAAARTAKRLGDSNVAHEILKLKK